MKSSIALVSTLNVSLSSWYLEALWLRYWINYSPEPLLKLLNSEFNILITQPFMWWILKIGPFYIEKVLNVFNLSKVIIESVKSISDRSISNRIDSVYDITLEKLLFYTFIIFLSHVVV